MRIDFTQLKETACSHLAPAVAIAGAITWGMLIAVVPHSAHASSKKDQAAGALVFQQKGCQHCHGTDGTGTDRGPDLSLVGKKWHKDHIEQQIREGGGGMPAFGTVLQPDEIKSLVDFLAAKRKPGHPGALVTPQNPPPTAKPTTDDTSE